MGGASQQRTTKFDATTALQQRLIASDGQQADNLGFAVAIDGDVAVVGDPAKNGGTGVVYVFTRSGDAWTQTGILTASDGIGSDNLGIAVAIDGDTIVAGAFYANNMRGAVYTFARTGDAKRTEMAKLTASDSIPEDNLGASVAIDGDTIVAGAPGVDNGAKTNAGALYTFDRTGPALRTETAKLFTSDGHAGDSLGDSVAIDGDTIVGGAPGVDLAGANDAGALYVFARNGSAWTQTAKLTASDAGYLDFLGQSVAIEGDTIVGGASGLQTGGNTGQGKAYTFAREGDAARTETAKLIPSDIAADQGLGSVGIDGDTIVVGAPGAPLTKGRVYAFARTGDAIRAETAQLTPSDNNEGDMFGVDVAIDGTTIVAGAPQHTVGANSFQGSAVIFFESIEE